MSSSLGMTYQLTNAFRFLLCVTLCGSPSVFAQTANPAFGDNGWATEFFLLGDADSYGNDVAVQADGKIVVVGFSDATEQDTLVIRYNTDGTLDASFSGDGKARINAGLDDRAKAVAIQADGKIVVAGLNYGNGGDIIDFLVIRLNTDGSLDSGFGDGGIVTTDFPGDDWAEGLAIQGDGKIVVVGRSNLDGNHAFAMARYNSDGSLDTSFDSDGLVTTVFDGHGGDLEAVAILGDGKILAGGGDRNDNAILLRYTASGVLDTTFDTDGRVTLLIGDGAPFEDMAVQGDGKIVAASSVSSNSGPPDFLEIAEILALRFNSNGSLDTGFDGDGMASLVVPDKWAYPSAIEIQADNKIVVAGQTYDTLSGSQAILVGRFNTDGSVDAGFDTDGYAETEIVPFEQNSASGLAIQGDGKIVVVGKADRDIAVVRYDSDGSQDTGFSNDGVVTLIAQAPLEAVYQAVVVQPDGKILGGGWTDNTSGSRNEFVLARYNSDGSPDTTFDSDGKVVTALTDRDDAIQGLALQADGKILAVDAARTSTTSDAALVRYNADGSRDFTFAGGAAITHFNVDDIWYTVAVQPDGKIVTAGGVKGLLGSGVDDMSLARFNSDGTPDFTFNGTGSLTSDIFSSANDIALRPDGKILVSGYLWDGSQYDIAVARFNSDGSLDTAFGEGDGFFVSAVEGPTSAQINPIDLQADGKIVVAGQFFNGSWRDIAIARYTEDGVPDTTFDEDGIAIIDLTGGNERGRDVHVQADGKILVAGYANAPLQNSNFMLVRFNADGSLDTDFETSGVGFYEQDDHSSHEAYAMSVANGHAYLAGQFNYAAALLDVGDGTNGSSPADITGMADTSGDGLADLATFVSNPGGQPQAELYSGTNGDNVGTLNFLNPDWQGVAIDTVEDSNGDGVADDPGVAMLLVETATGKMLVQTRNVVTGTSVKKINFLNLDWTPIDIVVFNDTNGDGNPNDASVGVMAVNKFTGKTLIQVRTLSTGAKIATRSFLNSDYEAIAATSASRAGQTPLLGVLSVETATGKTLVQTRQLSDGALVDNAKYLNFDYTATDIATIKDGNSDGVADDPGWLVLANHKTSNATLIQARYAATGARIENINYLTSDYAGLRLATSPDISGNSREEASVYAERLTDGQRIIQIRDFQDETKTGNIFP